MALAQFELFAKQDDTARRFIVLNVENFDQNSLFRALVSLNVGLVVDLRLRSVFDPPKYNHLAVLRYFTEREMQFVQFPLLQKKIYRREISILDQLHSRRVFSKNSQGTIVALIDSDEKSRENAKNLRYLFSRLRVQIVEVLATTALRR